MQEPKVYLNVLELRDENGKVTPQAIIYNGITYPIDRVLQVDRRASLKAGGCGIRYRILMGGHEKHIFLEDDRWFGERKK